MTNTLPPWLCRQCAMCQCAMNLDAFSTGTAPIEFQSVGHIATPKPGGFS